MISSTGILRGRRRVPNIYFICKHQYLYIGQTQDIPVIRWRDHIRIMGSFSSNLRDADEDAFISKAVISFAAYQCDYIHELLPEVQHRLVTQYVEHMAHVRVISHPLLGPRWALISDTLRTAVGNCKYEWADRMATAIVEQFAADSAAW
jgi:hypothetical protein